MSIKAKLYITLIIFFFSFLLNIILGFEINNLNEKLEISHNKIKKIIEENDSIKISKKQFNIFRCFAMPTKQRTVKIGENYETVVGLCVGNKTGEKPMVFIGDSLDKNGNLIGRIDTFYVENGISTIKRSYTKAGEKTIYGLYKIRLKGDVKYSEFRFEQFPNVIE